MTAKPVAFLLAELGVTKSHSRPHTSNDNPYGESRFRTLKYRPEFPDRFGCFQDAHAFCSGFIGWSRYAGDPPAGRWVSLHAQHRSTAAPPPRSAPNAP